MRNISLFLSVYFFLFSTVVHGMPLGTCDKHFSDKDLPNLLKKITKDVPVTTKIKSILKKENQVLIGYDLNNGFYIVAGDTVILEKNISRDYTKKMATDLTDEQLLPAGFAHVYNVHPEAVKAFEDNVEKFATGYMAQSNRDVEEEVLRTETLVSIVGQYFHDDIWRLYEIDSDMGFRVMLSDYPLKKAMIEKIQVRGIQENLSAFYLVGELDYGLHLDAIKKVYSKEKWSSAIGVIIGVALLAALFYGMSDFFEQLLSPYNH